jgi:osmotically-inducible protein OsmY
MRSDSEIKYDVERELQWDPEIDAADIGVSVKDGVVTLTGFAKSYSEELAAEAAVKRVAGVVGVVNDLKVHLPVGDERPDPEIARDAAAALRSWLPFASDHLKAVVQDGWITLEGEVNWNFQRWLAETAVRRLRGIKGITNNIQLAGRSARPAEIKAKIEEALKRSAAFDANQITVEVNGSEIVLKGTVHSWSERDEAERVAWSAPGVTRVDDRIAVVF